MKLKQIVKNVGIIILMLFVIPALNGCNGACSSDDISTNQTNACEFNGIATFYNRQAQNIEDCLNKSLTTSTPAI